MATAHVVFATITGNNEDIDIITEKLEQLGVDVTSPKFRKRTLIRWKTSISAWFVRTLTMKANRLKKGMDFTMIWTMLTLSGKVYGVAGSGDTFYGDDFALPGCLRQKAQGWPVQHRVLTTSKSTWSPKTPTSKP